VCVCVCVCVRARARVRVREVTSRIRVHIYRLTASCVYVLAFFRVWRKCMYVCA